MKDIVIEGRSLRRELFLLLGCIAAMICVNIGAIICYDRPWVELFTQAGYVLSAAVVLYLLVLAARLIVWCIIWIIKKLR